MGAISWLRRLAAPVVPQAVILLYHRVDEASRDPQLLCVTPENFALQMSVLRSRFRPKSLAGLSERGHLVAPRTVVVTFDDGYADNLHNAAPVLRHYDVPATVFVAAGFVETGKPPYWDELAGLLLYGAFLPSRLSLTIRGEALSWDFGSEPPVDPGWNLLTPGNLARQSAYTVLCDRLRVLTPEERGAVLAELCSWSGGHPAAGPRFMDAAELRQLAEGGLIEIGAHTVTHCNLAKLSLEAQRLEIAEGRAQLERITARGVCSFAYPYGTRDSYTRDTVRILGEEGFARACSNFGGTVRMGADRFQLPRVLVRNWSEQEFTRILDGYFG